MKIAVVGATGLVGTKMLEVLAERNFPVTELIPVASERSLGKQLEFRGKKYAVQSMKQAIRIFIDNAVKYTVDGDEITILCQKVNEDCVITIKDTGIGMTKKDIDHIFNRFYRSEHVRNQNISGHGLGLSLAKLIILAHTGKIKVRSQFKEGSSFIITLPKRKF